MPLPCCALLLWCATSTVSTPSYLENDYQRPCDLLTRLLAKTRYSTPARKFVLISNEGVSRLARYWCVSKRRVCACVTKRGSRDPFETPPAPPPRPAFVACVDMAAPSCMSRSLKPNSAVAKRIALVVLRGQAINAPGLVSTWGREGRRRYRQYCFDAVLILL